MSNQTEVRLKNEKIKRKYWAWLRGPEGMSELSIRAVENAIGKYEDSTKYEDFALFSPKKAGMFKKYLATNISSRSGITLGLTSRYYILRHVERFFAWLSSQPGYKSRISSNDAMYLKLSKNDRRQALSPKMPKYPSLEQVKTLCSFPIDTEIDQRDRALIAFTALTGMRDKAIVTLSMRCYEQESKLVKQLPSMGVETKFRKDIYTTLLPIDTDLLKYFEKWYTYLQTEKKFGLDNPIFPTTEVGLIGPNHHAYEAKGISKLFWSSAEPMRGIFRRRSKQVGIPYFYPHTFRHFVTAETEKHLSTPEQMKALSQNLGHEHIATTYRSYGAIDPGRVNEVVRSIDFTSTNAHRQSEEFAKQVAKQLFVMQENTVK
jgi:integrase